MGEREPATCIREGCELPRVSKGRKRISEDQTVRIYRKVCDKHHQAEKEARRDGIA